MYEYSYMKKLHKFSHAAFSEWITKL